MGCTGLFFVVSSPEAMAEADAVIENLLKVPMDAGLFFVFSSPEVMAEADAVIENLLKVPMDAGLFFLFSSPEVMAEADAILKNLLKVWGIHACSVLYRVQRSWLRLMLSLRTFSR
jgi:hypothetical protein